MADTDAPTASVVLDPPESLSFQLQPSTSPQAVLVIRNVSDSRKIAFKVKTTRPMRYLVRPNQGMLGPKTSAEIIVILQQRDCDELLYLDPAERQLSNDKFLVQSSYVDDSFYEVVKVKSAKEQADELTNMWNKADKRALANKKLKCRFTEGVDHAASDAATPTPVTLSPPTVAAPPMVTAAMRTTSTDDSTRVEQEVTTPEQLTAALLNQPTPPKSGGAADGDDKEWTVESVAALKKKYDELVAFTVQLTASRQSVMTDLERTRTLLEKANAKKDSESTLRQRKPGAASASADDNHGHTDRAVAAKDTTQQFGLYHLLVCAIVFFLIGRFY